MSDDALWGAYPDLKGGMIRPPVERLGPHESEDIFHHAAVASQGRRQAQHDVHVPATGIDDQPGLRAGLP